MRIDVLLPTVHFVDVIFAKQQQRIALPNRQPEPFLAECAGCRQLLGEQRFALAAAAIDRGSAAHRNPVRDEPLPRRDRQTVQRCRVDDDKRRIAFSPPGSCPFACTEPPSPIGDTSSSRKSISVMTQPARLRGATRLRAPGGSACQGRCDRVVIGENSATVPPLHKGCISATLPTNRRIRPRPDPTRRTRRRSPIRCGSSRPSLRGSELRRRARQGRFPPAKDPGAASGRAAAHRGRAGRASDRPPGRGRDQLPRADRGKSGPGRSAAVWLT